MDDSRQDQVSDTAKKIDDICRLALCDIGKTVRDSRDRFRAIHIALETIAFKLLPPLYIVASHNCGQHKEHSEAEIGDWIDLLLDRVTPDDYRC